MTTVANAMVRPRVETYLDSLRHRLNTEISGKVGGRDVQLRVLRSDGGLASVELAKEYCCNLLYSGPAGGIKGVAVNIAEMSEFKVNALCS